MFNQSQQKNNVQPVPQGVSQQRNGFGQLPTPGNPSFLNASVDDIGFELNPDTGAFELVDKRNQKPTEQQQQSQQANGQQGQAQNGGSPQPNQSIENPYADRFAAIDNQFKLMRDALTTMAGFMQNLQGGQGQQQQQQEQIKLDVQSDDFTTNLLNVINTSLEARFKSFKEELAPLYKTTNEMQGRMSMADVAFQNKDFQQLYPSIERIKKSDPTGNMTWQQAYEAARDIHNSFKQDSTIRTDNGSQQQAQQTQPQSVNQNLQDRANALATETGGVSRSVVQAEIPGKGIEDAFNKAVSDLYGGKP